MPSQHDPTPMTPYHLSLAAPAYARHYDPHTLNDADRARLHAHPSLADRAQWQTSRALLHHLRNTHRRATLCLSHKHGHTLIAHSEHGKPGADLETLRPRDFEALAANICSPQERTYLAQSAHPAHTFYQLWTLKEALIKAEDLRFPTDLPRIGLDPASQTLRSTRATPYRWLTLLINQQWIASALWPDVGNGHCQLHTYDCPIQSIDIPGGNLPLQIISQKT
ncbi:MAG: 4'-phosphopantetheinyl transferase superfamily protein [Cardiobacteriaceae bacterium]|nr:4'-phosphopantetheinyl transferase superfamily protein [Cardiobacteriaceae bacterium]